jgi:predicted dehydrogenase
MTRRRFVGNMVSATASVSLLGSATALAAATAAAQQEAGPKPPERRIKLGILGCGGRGAWLAGLFQKHGGYEMHALADYFQDAVDACGEAVGVDKTRRFTGLSGYKKLLDTGIEAIAIEDVCYFYPEQAKAALEAGCHVYMAKPVAIDVPGCMSILASGKRATEKNLCFHVDYQMPTDPVNIEVAKRIWDGGLGMLFAVTTLGGGGAEAMRADPPKEKTIESRLRGLIWNNDIPLGGDMIVNYDIHAIDAAIWIIRQRPISAVGCTRLRRPNPQSDFRDLYFVTYECADGLLWNHQTYEIPDHGRSLVCNVHGQLASAQISYWGKSFLRGGPQHYGGGEVESLYDQGALRNIDAFYRSVVDGKFDNPTVQRAVDGTLTAILGRDAAARGTKLTMEEVLKENVKLEPDLTGLKA